MAVAIGAGVSATVVGVMSIVAFLGRYVGTYTVSLDNANVALTLSEKSTFETTTSFLHIDTLPPYGEATFTELPPDNELDNEETDYLYGASYVEGTDEIDRLHFFKYTFYVKNVGDIAASYDFKINILENKPTDEAQPRYLTDTLRVMLYTTDVDSGETEKVVYGKERTLPVQIGDRVVREEPISRTEDDPKGLVDFQGGYCVSFADMRENLIAKITREDFQVRSVIRYTMVMWLEGEDKDSTNYKEPPLGAQVKLGIEINAHENQ